MKRITVRIRQSKSFHLIEIVLSLRLMDYGHIQPT